MSLNWLGWLVLLSPHSLPTFFLLAPIKLFWGSDPQNSSSYFTKGLIVYIFFQKHIHWQASHPAGSSITHTSFLCRMLLTSRGRTPLWQPPRISLPREKRRFVRSFPVRGRVAAWLTRTLRRPFLVGHGSSMTLMSCFPSLGNGDNASLFQ